MSLRLRLFLAFALLLAVLAALAAWGLARLDHDLDAALGASAVEVGAAVVTVLREHRLEARQGDEADIQVLRSERRAPGAETEREVHITVDGEPFAPGQALPPAVAERLAGLEHELHVQLLDAEGGAPRILLAGDGLSQSIPVPRAGIREAVADYSSALGAGLVALVALGLALAAVLAARVARPLQGLAAAARRLEAGELGARAEPAGAPEVRETVAAFNRMSARLAELDAEARRLREAEALAELAEVGRGLAHALRNPLHAIGLGVEELAEAGDGERPRQLAAQLRGQLGRVDQALRGFLALAAGEGAQSTSVALAAVAEDVVLEAAQRQPGVALRISGDEAATLPAVAAELRILVHALVVNAVEASPDGGEVGVRIERLGGDRIALEVVDRGAGVPDAVRDQLFAPHCTSKPHGAGMGLYMARRLARLRYDGEVSLQAREGGGTIARLELGPRREA